MAIIPLTASAVDRAIDVLARGGVVVLPFPSPLPYAVLASSPATVNAAKGRPLDQPSGNLVHRSDATWQRSIDLPADVLAFAVRVGAQDMANLLLPVRSPAAAAGPPDWVSSSTHRGHLGVTMAWRPDTAAIGAALPHLCVSSANQTGTPPCANAAQAAAAFPPDTLVLDGDAERDVDRPHGSATILRFSADAEVQVDRRGINDSAFPDVESYLRHLRRSCAAPA